MKESDTYDKSYITIRNVLTFAMNNHIFKIWLLVMLLIIQVESFNVPKVQGSSKLQQQSSLVEETLASMEEDEEFQETKRRISEIGYDGMRREEKKKRRRALNKLGISPFSKFLRENHNIGSLHRRDMKILQLNIGLYCNQACSHCHVESSPLRKDEMMTVETVVQCLELLKSSKSVTTLDITGGAPELNKNFRLLVSMARFLCPGIEIIDRCNLTVLFEPGQEDLISFLKSNSVRIVASLPCYSEANVDKQRGRGVFDRSIAALQALNKAGYGMPGSDFKLDLVYNPGGAFLPPSQSKLEEAYKKELRETFSIEFNNLFAITNMPIKRFVDFLNRNDELENYMNLLVSNFNIHTVDNLMCLDTVSVGYDGKIYDCDFNQQMGIDMRGSKTLNNNKEAKELTVHNIKSFSQLNDVKIRTDNHCFGCTAGTGSS